MELLAVKNLALQGLLLHQLQVAIATNEFAPWINTPASGCDRALEGASGSPICQQIPLYRGKDSQRVVYICAAGLKFAKQSPRSAMEIATAIAQGLSHLPDSTSGLYTQGRQFEIEIYPPGKIHLKLTDRGLSQWLQSLLGHLAGAIAAPASAPKDPGAGDFSSSTRLFRIQYAHARCCSLLRMADRQGILSGIQPEGESAIAPDPIPWLDPQGQFRLDHPTERDLISQVVNVLDTLQLTDPCAPPPRAMKWARDLSQDFLTFYAANPIWSEIYKKNIGLAQARLGAIAICQKLLKLLLEEGLSAFAPREL